jgi:DNA primase
VTFPLVEDGSVINIYGRSLSDRFKHMYLPARRDVVFNIEHAKGDLAILTESVIDALTLVGVGIPDPISGLSARLTARQVDVISSRFTRCAIAFDGDAPGREGAEASAASLRARGVDVRVVSLPDGEDVNSLAAHGMTRRDFEGLVTTAGRQT